MNLNQEFDYYSKVMLERDRTKIFKTISFKFSISVTNLLMNLGYNKRILKNEKNKVLNIGAGNLSFDKASNTDLFPSIGQILKGQLKRNSNKDNKYYLNLMKKEKSFENYWEGIVLSHVIEHIPTYLVKMCLKNIREYLKEGGKIRILVPDPKKYFLDSDKKDLSPQSFYNNFFSLNRLFYGWEHQFMYSENILKELLQQCGFINIQICSFGKGELNQFDAKEREFESLCITAER